MLTLLLISVAVSFVIVLGLAAPAIATPTHVLLLGDSITEGCVSVPGQLGADCSCPDGVCFAEELSARLGNEYLVTNAGVGGATTADWTSSIVTQPNVLVDGTPTALFEALAVPNLPAEIVVIMLGGNDAIGFFEPAPIAPMLYLENLTLLLEMSFGLGADHVVLVEPPPILTFGPIVQERLTEYAAIIDSLCTLMENVACGPALLSILTADDFEESNVHPNALGHQKIASKLANTIEAIPEPSTAILFTLGLVTLVRRRRSPGSD